MRLNYVYLVLMKMVNGCCVGSIGQNPESIKQVISWVKQITPLPLITKLNAHVNNIVVIGEAAQKAGAAGIAAINTVKGFCGIKFSYKFTFAYSRRHVYGNRIVRKSYKTIGDAF